MKIDRTKALILLNTVFICLAVLTIVLHLPLLLPDSPELLIKDLIVPLVSTIILFFAFVQSRKGNEIQSSLVFYNEEYNRVETLLKKIEVPEVIPSISQVIQIELISNFKTPIMYYRVVLEQFKAEKKVFQFINNEPQGRSKYHSVVRDTYFHIKDYYVVIERLYECLERIVKLHKKKYVVEAHKELMFYKLTPVLLQFVVFAEDAKKDKLYNPLLPPKFIYNKGEFDLLSKDSAYGLSQKVKDIYKREAYKLDDKINR